MIAQTPDQKQAGLRPFHEAGRTDASMAFPDVPPNTPFNTVGMKAPIDLKKYDEQGHLVKSYENVPPGLTNIDSGPARGMVLETPTRMQEGDFVKTVEPMDDDDPNAPQIGDPGADRGSLLNTVLADLYNVETRASDKANEAVKANEVPGEGDSYRHALASAYAVNKLRNYGLSPGMSLLGANAMGLFHELTAKSNNTFRESAEDVFNNLAGSLVGVFQDDKGAEATTKMLANRILPDGMAQEYKNYQVGGFPSAGPTVPDFVATGPKVRINGEEYQSTKRTGATRTAMQRTPDGEMAPSVLLPAAEVYDSAINRVPEDYSPETKALADEGARGVTDRRNQAAGMGLAAVGDFFTTAQRYGVSAPLALARGKTPNLSGTPLLDRAVGAESPNAFPSEILGIQNPYGAVATDILTDPMAAFALTTLGKQGLKAGRNYAALRRFKSEIDWGAWNPDTPNHRSLMREYKRIEFNTKKNGTWMKNADGSAYKGSPEQFVQENSSHFKKAYPLGANRLYHGTWNKYTPKVGPADPNANKFVFTADEDVARNYMDLHGIADKWSVPLATPQKIATPIGSSGREAASFSLLQPKSPNKYSIISQGDKWDNVVIGGRTKEELPKNVAFQKEQAAAHRAKIAAGDDSLLRQQLATSSENRAARYQYWYDWYDKLVQRTPSKAPNFEAALKSNNQAGSYLGGKTALLTDGIAKETVEEGVDYTILYGLDDGGESRFVNIHNSRQGNYLKSRIGNVGFFDLNDPNVFKAAAPIGIGAGLMSQRKHGGYRKAQQGTVVDYLLPALEANNPTEFADTQASNQAQNVRKRQADLSAEQQRVQDVRANVVPTAENLEQLNYDILNANNIFGSSSEYRPHLAHFNKMKRAKTPAEYKELEAEAKKSYPELLEAIPENNIMVMNPNKYNADDELYCTPYGCYTYKKAGATDVPEYSGNYGFVGGVKSGKNPFKRISAAEAEPGDVALMTEYSPVDYRDPSKGRALRPHHTTILSQKTNNPDEIYAYQADDGTRLKFRENLLKARDVRDDEGKIQEGRFDYYRYIGQTPYMQRAVGDAKHNQKQADMVAQAMQQQADIAAQIPDRDLTDLETIDRRGADRIKTNDVSQDIVDTTTEVPEQKKSGKQKVEQLSNTLQGKVETAKERKARIKAINKRTRQNIRNIRKG